jgi:hypothetical protein
MSQRDHSNSRRRFLEGNSNIDMGKRSVPLRALSATVYPALLATLVSCGNEPKDVLTAQEDALTVSSSGSLEPFGGVDGTCLQETTTNGIEGLQVATCGGAGETFRFDGFTVKDAAGLCFDIRFGDLNAGVLDLVTCNGTVNQQWYFSGGQLVSANRSDGQPHCLDVHLGNHGIGTPIGVAPCNGTNSQSFWPAGQTVQIPSVIAAGNKNCLDVNNDAETAGTLLDDAECNATNAQWFQFDLQNRIHLANNQNLCLSSVGTAGSAPKVKLANCSSTDATERWWFANKEFDSVGRPVTTIVNNNGGCTDIFQGSNQSGASVDTFTCNNTAAQLWQPVVTSPSLLTNYGGGTLTTPTVYQLYYGSWWNTTNGQIRMHANEQHVAAVVNYINGVGAPSGQAPFLRQYGIASATLATPPTTGIADNLIRTSSFTPTGGSITSGAPATIFLPSMSFSSVDIGNTISVSGASNPTNNTDFVLLSIIDGQHARIGIAPLVRYCKQSSDCGGSTTCSADNHCADAPRPVTESFGANVRIIMSRAGLLDNEQSKGGSASIEAILANARAAGTIPNTTNNVLVLVFPSFDFIPNACDPKNASVYAPPSPNPNTCDASSGAYHTSETAGAHAAFGVLYERIDERAPDRAGGRPSEGGMNAGTSHEMVEAILNPFYGQANSERGWTLPNGTDPCDLCGNLSNDAAICGIDNRQGGQCTSTGYIAWPF